MRRALSNAPTWIRTVWAGTARLPPATSPLSAAAASTAPSCSTLIFASSPWPSSRMRAKRNVLAFSAS
eukprot:15458860-Alexandrium_andersonii.AAC.1